jgi:hypothetical protein
MQQLSGEFSIYRFLSHNKPKSAKEIRRYTGRAVTTLYSENRNPPSPTPVKISPTTLLRIVYLPARAFYVGSYSFW